MSERKYASDVKFKMLMNSKHMALHIIDAMFKGLIPDKIKLAKEMKVAVPNSDNEYTNYDLNVDSVLFGPTELQNMRSKVIRLDSIVNIPVVGEKNMVSFTFNFEMQGLKPTDYDITNRAIYYATTLYSSLLSSGSEYKAPKVVSVWFLGYKAFNDDEPIRIIGLDTYKSNHSNVMNRDGVIDDSKSTLEHLNIVFVELPKFKRLTDNMEIRELMEALRSDEGVDDYMRRYKESDTMWKAIDWVTEYKEEVKKEVKKEVEEEVRAEVKEQSVAELIISMYRNNMSIDQISNIVGDKEFVESVINRHNNSTDVKDDVKRRMSELVSESKRMIK